MRRRWSDDDNGTAADRGSGTETESSTLASPACCAKQLTRRMNNLSNATVINLINAVDD
jgi:hypothetical protein